MPRSREDIEAEIERHTIAVDALKKFRPEPALQYVGWVSAGMAALAAISGKFDMLLGVASMTTLGGLVLGWHIRDEARRWEKMTWDAQQRIWELQDALKASSQPRSAAQ